MTRKLRIRAGAVGTVAATVAATFALGTSPAQAAASCQDLGNGRLCVYTHGYIGSHGDVQVTYNKTGGNSFFGNLAWHTGAGPTWGSPVVAMHPGNTYSHKWPTWINGDCVFGLIQFTDGRAPIEIFNPACP